MSSEVEFEAKGFLIIESGHSMLVHVQQLLIMFLFKVWVAT